MPDSAASRRTTAARWLPALLALVCLLLYGTFRSASLDDFDAYSFALALKHFDLALQQPQPPGFPIYVALGRGLYALTGDPVAALTALSALSGVAVTVLVYALGRQIPADGGTAASAAILAALWIALVPVSWLTAEKALSDTPGLAATLLALWLLWRWQIEGRGLALASLAVGLALGVRPQNALPLALLGGYGLARRILRHRGREAWRALGQAALGGGLGVALWLVPTALAVGGLPAYAGHLRAHAAHVGRADSLLGTGLPLATALRARAVAFAETLLLSTLGVGTPAPWLPVLALVVLLAVGLARADWRRREVRWLAVWAAAMAAQVFLFETLDRPRLLLPALPPLALLAAHGWARPWPRTPAWLPRAWRPAALLAITGLALLATVAPLAATLSQVPAPPAQATAHVKARYPAAETLVAAAGSFRAAQVELPGYPLLYLYTFDAEGARRAVAAGPRYIVVLDRDQFPESALAVLRDGGRYVPLDERTFARDRRVHTQHDQVRMQVLTPAALVPASALELPPGGCIDLGGESDARYLTSGWFRPEAIGGVQGRWAGGSLTSTLRLALAPGREYRVRFRALAYPEGQAVTLRVGETALATVALATAWSEYEAALPVEALPAEALPGDAVTTLALVHALAPTPREISGGTSADARHLAAAYDWVCVVTQTGE